MPVTYKKDGITYTGQDMNWAQQHYKRAKASGEHQKGVTAGRTHDSQHLAPRNINYKNLPDHHLNAQDKQIVQQYTGNQAAQTSMPTSQPARSPISNLNK
jgi:hypothetical protein